jgi:hypothetical protein
MTILAKMHDKMAAQAPRYATPQSASGGRHYAAQPVHRPAAPALAAVPANLFEEIAEPVLQPEPPLTFTTTGLTLMDVFRMFAAAQDEPGRTVSAIWQVGTQSSWRLSVNFNLKANTASWKLEVNDGQSNITAMDCQNRDLTGVYRAVLENKRIA